jgi:RimJ/RimL family protein N-acetyltransferase
MTTTIRRATRDDAAHIADVIAEVFKDPNPVGLDAQLSREGVEAWMARQGDHGALLVAKDDGTVVGFASVDFDSGRADECSIGAWVRPSHRRRGYASALFEGALAFAREQGYRRVRGRLPEGNEAALSFLSSVGALVPIMNPGAQYELPIYEVRT